MVKQRQTEGLRYGFTTGACAAAAAKAAAYALVNQRMPERVTIDLRNGEKASFKISECLLGKKQATCSVIKDAGDDPDVTHGAEIRATLSLSETGNGIEISGGKGVGMVTKPGLEIPVGLHAINPVPRLMITESVKQVDNAKGFNVVISVPKGKQLARRTLNSRIGIIGGISILGTTGIVIPYSPEAYTACISQSMDVAVASGCDHVVLTTGRRSEKFAQAEYSKLPEEAFIQSGDFIDHSLEQASEKRFRKVTIWGMIGKISKIAAGNFYTNVSDSLVDISFMAEVAADAGLPAELIEKLKTSVTANHFRRMLPPEYLRQYCDRLCCVAAEKSREEGRNVFGVECVMADSEGNIIGRADAG